MHQTSKVVATTCAAVLLGLATVAGQSSSAPTQGPPTSGVSSKAFLRLFSPGAEARPQVESQLEAARRKLKDVESGSARRFICGIPVLRANPAIDPTFVVPPPGTGTQFSMRSVPPPCQ